MTELWEDPETASVTLIDHHDANQLAVRVWCGQADPPIAVRDGYASTAEFLTADRGPLPKVVVVDLERPGQPPDFPGLQEVVARGHRVIVYSSLVRDDVILRCLELGVATFVAAPEGNSHLIDAIRAAMADEPYVGPRMAAVVVRAIEHGITLTDER